MECEDARGDVKVGPRSKLTVKFRLLLSRLPPSGGRGPCLILISVLSDSSWWCAWIPTPLALLS